MKRIIGALAGALVLAALAVSGGSVSAAHAASFGCTSGGQAGASVPAGTSDVKTGGLIDYSCNKTWIAGGDVWRYSGGSWGHFNPVHIDYIAGHAHNCGNGVSGSSDVFECPSGANSNFAANTGWYLTGPEWVYQQNLTTDIAVEWTIISVDTSEQFSFYVCPDGDVHGGLPSGGCPS